MKSGMATLFNSLHRRVVLLHRRHVALEELASSAANRPGLKVVKGLARFDCATRLSEDRRAGNDGLHRLGLHLLGAVAMHASELCRDLNPRADAGRDNAICQTRREFCRPLGDSLRVDSYGVSSLGNCAAKQFNGFGLLHAAHVSKLTTHRQAH